MSKHTFLTAGALLLAACGEPAVNSGDQVVVRVVNSTGLTNAVVRVTSRGSSSETTLSASQGTSATTLVMAIEVAGEPAVFEVTVGGEIVHHTCHVHADAIGNPDNLPTAVLYGQPLRVVCQSGWQQQEDDSVHT